MLMLLPESTVIPCAAKVLAAMKMLTPSYATIC